MAPGVLASVWTMALSFSPESIQAPSVRTGWALALNAFSSDFESAFSVASFLAPASSASSTKASRVPEVGGGP